MHTGLSKAGKVDQPLRKMMKITKKADECCCTEEPVAEIPIEVPAAKSLPDWQKEEPPYFHRDIF